MRTKSPVATSRTSESAICTTMSPRASCERLGPPSVRAPPWNAAARSMRVARHAGARPNTSAVASAVAAVKVSTRASSGRSSTTVLCPNGRSATRRPRPHHANATPSAAPASPSTSDSVSSWRTTRHRPAPSARRSATSLRRAEPRASSRFATLAQAASSTRLTSPMRTSNDRRYCRRVSFSPWAPGSATSSGASGIEVGARSVVGPARQPSRAASWNTGSSAAAAWTRVAPGASRPMMRTHQ